MEDLMMAEAIRLSLEAEEVRRKKEEKEAEKEAKKKEKAAKKSAKRGTGIFGLGNSSKEKQSRSRSASLEESPYPGGIDDNANSTRSLLVAEGPGSSQYDDSTAGLGKGKGVDRGLGPQDTASVSAARNAGANDNIRDPMDFSDTLPVPAFPILKPSRPSNPQATVVESSLEPPSPMRSSHLRQMSRTSHSSSSSLTHQDGSGAASIRNDGTSGTPPANEPMFNFASLEEKMYGVDVEKKEISEGQTSEHKENATLEEAAGYSALLGSSNEAELPSSGGIQQLIADARRDKSETQALLQSPEMTAPTDKQAFTKSDTDEAKEPALA
jgi:hypothetical protein